MTCAFLLTLTQLFINLVFAYLDHSWIGAALAMLHPAIKAWLGH